MSNNATTAWLLAHGLYDRKTCNMMADEQAEKLMQLHQQFTEAFDAICVEYALSLGHDPTKLTAAQKNEIAEEVETLVEEYDENDTDGQDQKKAMESLKRHHNIGLEIMNVRDDVVRRRDT